MQTDKMECEMRTNPRHLYIPIIAVSRFRSLGGLFAILEELDHDFRVGSKFFLIWL